tara:strand:- start:273 stop:410 length:138 start_codon:yes stop_codon:yes gene_type:complete
MRTNQSHQTKDSLLEEYKYRIEALLNKVNFLEAQLEVSKLMNFNN